jgi:predicted DNA-binding transcriptional regulator AlpA
MNESSTIEREAETLERLLSERELSAICNIPAGTLRALRSSGRAAGPPFIKIGGAVRYRPSDVHAFLESNKQESNARKETP